MVKYRFDFFAQEVDHTSLPLSMLRASEATNGQIMRSQAPQAGVAGSWESWSFAVNVVICLRLFALLLFHALAVTWYFHVARFEEIIAEQRWSI